MLNPFQPWNVHFFLEKKKKKGSQCFKDWTCKANTLLVKCERFIWFEEKQEYANTFSNGKARWKGMFIKKITQSFVSFLRDLTIDWLV